MSLAHQIKPSGIASQALASLASEGVPVASIRIDGGTQSRAMLQQSVIEEYAYALLDGVKFPPVVIFYDGADHWLADGFHRVRAHMEASIDLVPADVRQGTRRDAILYSVGANEAHGLRRTNDDKRRAVMTLLNDAEWAKWSDREIARQCVVDHKTVSALRGKHLGKSPDSRTVERNGSAYTMNTSAIGKSATKQADQEMETQDAASVVLKRGPKLALAEGMTLDRMAREGMAREIAGEPTEALAKEYRIGADYFRKACDVVFLFDRGGYSKPDQEIVARAFSILVDEMRPLDAREAIDPVAVKVWGPGRLNGRVRPDREPPRVEQFERSLAIFIQTCLTTEEIDLPYLSAERAHKAIKEIGAARAALARFAQRIKDIHE